MMNNSFVSIIIPVCNGEKTLARCLESILSQDYPNLEILVIDNNSTDKTKEIITNFIAKDNRIKYFFEPYQSRGAARALGCQKAAGEIIGMTDADCIVPSSWVSKMVRPIVTEGFLVVQGAEENLDSRSKYLRPVFNENIVAGRVNTNNFFIHKTVLTQVGNFDSKFFRSEDTEFSIRLDQAGIKVKFLDVTIEHLRSYSLINNIIKFYEGGYWCAQATKKHLKFLYGHQFLKDSNQTIWYFAKFFPGLFKTLILKGPLKTGHDLVTGLAWRIGLVSGWLKKYE